MPAPTDSTTTGLPRIGVFGGSFDPPHRGHLAVALAAVSRFHLGQLVFLPAALQPLKPSGATAPYLDRMAMTQLLCDAAAAAGPAVHVSVSALDAAQPNGAPNYTIDTLARLRKHFPPPASLWMIVGADSFSDLRRWRAPDALLAAAEWIVVSRPGFSLDALALSSSQKQKVHLLDGVAEPASATEIRRRLALGDDCDDWLSAPVRSYIRHHNLYTPS